jgi:hypothetical protein
MYDIDILDQLPQEPFKVTHNEFESLGGLVQIRLDGFTFWNGERTVEVSAETYDAVAGNGVVKFTAPEVESSITIRPLKLTDRSLISNGEQISSLEKLRLVAIELLAFSVAP